MNESRMKLFLDAASKVGERTKAAVLIEMTHEGKLNIHTNGDPFDLHAMVSMATAHVFHQTAIKMSAPRPVPPPPPEPPMMEDPNQLKLPLTPEENGDET